MARELGIRHKLVLLSLVIVVVVSFAFTALHLILSRAWIEEDLKSRAITFARELAATIGDRREFESAVVLRQQIEHIMAVRQNVLQLDILAFGPHGTDIVATSEAGHRLPFGRSDAAQVARGDVISRLITQDGGRYWEVMAPVTLDRAVVGAVAAKFSLEQADRLAARVRRWALLLTAGSVLVMGVLMGLAVHVIVTRPLHAVLDAVARIKEGDRGATVRVERRDEIGVLGGHFNEMMERINRFSGELETRVQAATAELDRRYSEVRRLNEQLLAMRKNLARSERLALLGRMMAQVAHEVGTPLHSVAGHLELLRREIPADGAPADVVRRLAIVDAQVARVIEIITELLDVTRGAPAARTTVDLNQLVLDTVDLLRPAFDTAAHTLDVAMAPERPLLHGHAGQLQQIVLNVLTNALDATPPGGRVGVATRLDVRRREVSLDVTDTGPGIPVAARKEIFEAFFSTKQPGRGAGLGLFISAQIAREHGGRIDLESEEGEGSTFSLVLPLPGEAA
ncbi:MAG: sensor histidine kinase [Candidatus Rokuibacteriota bacterium]